MHVNSWAKAHGCLTFNLGWRGGWQTFDVWGGPFDGYEPQPGSIGVCVRAERVPKGKVDVWLPIPDFDVPRDSRAVDEALRETLGSALAGSTPYVGCMGGYGRTGLFLALIAKATGVPNPVTYVRENYHPHAVETIPQQEFVATYDVGELRRWLHRQGWRHALTPLAFWRK